MVNSSPVYTAVRRRPYVRSATYVRMHTRVYVGEPIEKEKEREREREREREKDREEIIEYTFSVHARFIYS